MDTHPKAADFFVAGGPLRANAPSYVERPADDELFRQALACEFSYVLTCRQMGKSSLMNRTAQLLQRKGVRTVTIDLTAIGSDVSVENWYLGLLVELTRKFRLSIDPKTWWHKHAFLGSVQRFIMFLRDVVLAEIGEHVVIFVDEIDTTLNLDFSDDFFAAIRSVYNARDQDPAFGRLSFVFLGVASPPDLIKDTTRTPFNIGTGVALQDFSLSDAAVLQAGLEKSFPGQGTAIFSRVYHWTNGHPYLTQTLCKIVTEQGGPNWTDDKIDGLVEQLFLAEGVPTDSNLQFVQDRILKAPQCRRLLGLYRKIYRGQEIRDNPQSPLQNQLKLSGLVNTHNGRLLVRNEIYRRAFDLKWIKEHTQRDWNRIITAVAVVVTVLTLFLVGRFVWYNYVKIPDEAEKIKLGFYGTARYESKDRRDQDRVTYLARLLRLRGLFGAPDYDYDARELFSGLEREDQRALFSVENADADKIMIIAEVYTTLADVDGVNGAGGGSDLLQDMAEVLSSTMQTKQVTDMRFEINTWLDGRKQKAQAQYGEALEKYTDVIELNSENQAARYERALVFIALGEYGHALDDLELVVASAKGEPETANTPALPIETLGQMIREVGSLMESHPELLDILIGASESEYPNLRKYGLASPVAGSARKRDRDDMVMVFAPGGRFQMGNSEADLDAAFELCEQDRGSGNCDRTWFEDESPPHRVTLDAFWIDKYEVTNAQYRQCVEAGVCEAPTTCDWGEPTYGDESKADHPVVCVDWDGANTYCEWTEARLPTEAEWEYAARGPQENVYPWGDAFDCSRGNFDDETQENDYVVPGGAGCDGNDKTAPVGSFEAGASWLGALDMAGNVWEWVNDWYQEDYYAVSPDSNPTGPETGDFKVLRGGSWHGGASDLRSAIRDWVRPRSSNYYIGFRCVVAATSLSP